MNQIGWNRRDWTTTWKKESFETAFLLLMDWHLLKPDRGCQKYCCNPSERSLNCVFPVSQKSCASKCWWISHYRSVETRSVSMSVVSECWYPWWEIYTCLTTCSQCSTFYLRSHRRSLCHSLFVCPGRYYKLLF